MFMAENILENITTEIKYMAKCELIELIKEGEVKFRDIPDKKMTENVCVALISSGECRLGDIPVEKRTPAVCKYALDEGVEIRLIPEELLTDKMCLYAIDVQGPEVLEDIPREKRTPEICEYALDRGVELRLIPEESMTPEVYAKVLKERQYRPDILIKRVKSGLLSYDEVMKCFDLTNDGIYNEFLDAVKESMHGKLNKLCENFGVGPNDELQEEYVKLFEGALEEMKQKIEAERKLQKEVQKKCMDIEMKKLRGEEESQPNQ